MYSYRFLVLLAILHPLAYVWLGNSYAAPHRHKQTVLAAVVLVVNA